MKKILSLVLCLVILISAVILSSCDAIDKITNAVQNSGITDAIITKSPEKLYRETIEKIDDLENYTLTSTQEITMTYDNETSVMNQTVVAKKDYENEYMKLENDTVSDANIESWYVNEVFYANMMGMQFKASIDYDDYIEKYLPEGGDDDSALLDLPQNMLKDVDFERDEDGRYYLKFIISGREFEEYMDDLGITDDLTNANISDVSYKVYFYGDGTLGETVTAFNMDVEGIFMSYKIVTVLSEIGSTQVALPEGAEAWSDMTSII